VSGWTLSASRARGIGVQEVHILLSDWREQLLRIVRWKARLWLDPILHKEHAVDSFYAFTAACYHLIDWLENDPSQPIRREQAEAHVFNSEILKFCGDICNGSKHAQLEPKKVRVRTEKTEESIRVGDDDLVVEHTHLFVEWKGDYIDIEDFAALCVEEWTRLLMREGLGPVLRALFRVGTP
jgi:hypothetical protein